MKKKIRLETNEKPQTTWYLYFVPFEEDRWKNTQATNLRTTKKWWVEHIYIVHTLLLLLRRTLSLENKLLHLLRSNLFTSYFSFFYFSPREEKSAICLFFREIAHLTSRQEKIWLVAEKSAYVAALVLKMRMLSSKLIPKFIPVRSKTGDAPMSFAWCCLRLSCKCMINDCLFGQRGLPPSDPVKVRMVCHRICGLHSWQSDENRLPYGILYERFVGSWI